jgi:hypothetical protein
MGFSWDKGMDWLWRERVELIGDQRSDEVGESIEHGTVLGQSEGRELLDVTDDGLDDATPIEQSLVWERDRQPLHVAAHPRDQGQAAPEQALGEVFADIAFVAEQLADQVRKRGKSVGAAADQAGRILALT